MRVKGFAVAECSTPAYQRGPGLQLIMLHSFNEECPVHRRKSIGKLNLDGTMIRAGTHILTNSVDEASGEVVSAPIACQENAVLAASVASPGAWSMLSFSSGDATHVSHLSRALQ
eukprot:3717871-Amphidinium_carterae.1